jgi:hypothetical protein
MIKALLILVFVTNDGAHLMAVQPFDNMLTCITEQDRLAPNAKSNLPSGQGYALSCVPVDVAGAES